MRRCKWIRRSTINYEIPDLANTADSLTPLVEIGLVQDSKKCSTDSDDKSLIFVDN